MYPHLRDRCFLSRLHRQADMQPPAPAPSPGAPLHRQKQRALGFILTICGAAGLLYRRLTDEKLKIYSSFEHYFNLILFIVTMGAAVLTWLFVDPSFVMAKTFIAGLISFKLTGISNPLFLIQILLIVATITYIPFTHMSHFFMKYFLYHDIRWDDKPNIDSPETNAKINVVLNYPVTWSASHIAGHGKNTWDSASYPIEEMSQRTRLNQSPPCPLSSAVTFSKMAYLGRISPTRRAHSDHKPDLVPSPMPAWHCMVVRRIVYLGNQRGSVV